MKKKMMLLYPIYHKLFLHLNFFQPLYENSCIKHFYSLIQLFDPIFLFLTLV